MVMPDYFEKTEARILQEFAEATATRGPERHGPCRLGR